MKPLQMTVFEKLFLRLIFPHQKLDTNKCDISIQKGWTAKVLQLLKGVKKVVLSINFSATWVSDRLFSPSWKTFVCVWMKMILQTISLPFFSNRFWSENICSLGFLGLTPWKQFEASKRILHISEYFLYTYLAIPWQENANLIDNRSPTPRCCRI